MSSIIKIVMKRQRYLKTFMTLMPVMKIKTGTSPINYLVHDILYYYCYAIRAGL